jgi:NAD(P)-dependent dehydrogenase (short-subunit alcohol dehydrogenase family)
LRLAREGWTVYATARRPETLVELAAAGCRTLALDVDDEASVERAVATVEAAHGAVGVLINNAGYGQSGAVEQVSPELVRRQFETNVFGLLRLTQRVLPRMRARGWGRIVNLGSMGGRLTFPGGGVYHATKHALEALTDALRYEVGGFGVDVVLVQPGLIRTRFSSVAVTSMDAVQGGPYAELDRAVAKATVDSYVKPPLSWLAGDPEDVAATIARAVRARRPRTRYKVSASAHVFMGLRRLLPDRLWDLSLRSTYPRPGLGRHALARREVATAR